MQFSWTTTDENEFQSTDIAYVYLCVTNLTVESKSHSDWQQQIFYLNREAHPLSLSHLLIHSKFCHLQVLMLNAQDMHLFIHIMPWWWLNCSSFKKEILHIREQIHLLTACVFSYSGVDCHYFVHLSSIISCYRHKDTHKSVSYSSLLLFLFLLLLSLFSFSFLSLSLRCLFANTKQKRKGKQSIYSEHNEGVKSKLVVHRFTQVNHDIFSIILTFIVFIHTQSWINQNTITSKNLSYWNWIDYSISLFNNSKFILFNINLSTTNNCHFDYIDINSNNGFSFFKTIISNKFLSKIFD
jgi:hypothetical protein